MGHSCLEWGAQTPANRLSVAAVSIQGSPESQHLRARHRVVGYLQGVWRGSDMTQLFGMKGSGLHSVPIAMVIVVLAVGLCFVQVTATGTHHDGMSPDLCAGFFLGSFFVALLYLVQVVALPLEPVPVTLVAAPRSLDPPPKHSPLS